MTIYAGLDVSDKTVHVCVVDDAGVVLQRDVVATDPEVLNYGESALNYSGITVPVYYAIR